MASSSINGNQATDQRHSLPGYVLVTPARNEETFIAATIESMIRQTVRPLKWVIVDDGSTDKTAEIVNRYVDRHSWIELIHMPQRRDRSFAAKVQAFNAGYERVKGLGHDVVGNLDADIIVRCRILRISLAEVC